LAMSGVHTSTPRAAPTVAALLPSPDTNTTAMAAVSVCLFMNER
jgi:hypothetical protein